MRVLEDVAGFRSHATAVRSSRFSCQDGCLCIHPADPGDEITAYHVEDITAPPECSVRARALLAQFELVQSASIYTPNVDLQLDDTADESARIDLTEHRPAIDVPRAPALPRALPCGHWPLLFRG